MSRNIFVCDICHTIHLSDNKHKLSVEKTNIEWKRLPADSDEVKQNWRRMDICDDCYKSFFNCSDSIKIGDDVLKKYGQDAQLDNSTTSTNSIIHDNTKTIKPKSDDEPYVPRKKTSVRSARKVKCVEDGRVFDSVKKASEAYGINVASIYSSLNRGIRCKGVTFKWVDNLEALFNSKEIRVGDVA